MNKLCSKYQPSYAGSAHVSRRTFLGGITASTFASGVLGCGGVDRSVGHADRRRFQSPISAPSGPMAMPGPFPGRVVEVSHSGSVTAGMRHRDAVKIMMDYGMGQLVPDAETAVDAWRSFFHKGDRVAIKVVPVGKVAKPGPIRRGQGCVVDLKRPGSISSYEVVLEVIDGLTAAGVRLSDILVTERYRDEFIEAGYNLILPDGVHWECSSVRFDQPQLEIDGQIRGESRQKNVSGYDRDIFRELSFCHPAEIHDPDDDRRFRSHLSKIVTQKVDKVVSIPVLKDHSTGGVTLALKNMSHGFHNNVSRSHVGADFPMTLNHCQTFIPAACSLPHMREKCVLQILDGLVGTYEGGPGNWNKTFATWEYKSLLLATDPVALDHIGWEILDAKRAQEGWPSVARMGTDAQSGIELETTGNGPTESFHIRQPQHVPLAGLLGLGTFERHKIDHQRFDLG